LLGFYDGGSEQHTIADLLAIAVHPNYQRMGIGRTLLDFAIRMAELASRARRVQEIQLTVADTNAVGQRLFTSSGFQILNQHHGFYDGGQRAIRMTRALA
jgi:ribosomal protein S18 acetylase RimI-like enzyme